MPSVQANGIRIEYEVYGDPAGEAILLIQGYGLQLIHWPDGLVGALADEDYHVIRFDNRDIGLSQRLEGVPPTTVEELRAVQTGELEASYTHDDMAEDAFGLLDALEVATAHLVGFSMGTAIARKMAVRHPERVRSVVMIATSTREPGLPRPERDVARTMAALFTIESREEFIAHQLVIWKLVTGEATYDENEVRRLAERAYDRAGIYRQGLLRQQAAAAAGILRGEIREELSQLRAPTLVIAGRLDPLNPLEHGVDAARAIPGAELLVIDELGHETPPRLTESILAHVRTATAVA